MEVNKENAEKMLAEIMEKVDEELEEKHRKAKEILLGDKSN